MIILVQEVEESLVSMIRLSGNDSSCELETTSTAEAAHKTLMKGVGPAVPSVSEKGQAVSGQDEVDDLLSSLGF